MGGSRSRVSCSRRDQSKHHQRSRGERNPRKWIQQVDERVCLLLGEERLLLLLHSALLAPFLSLSLSCHNDGLRGLGVSSNRSGEESKRRVQRKNGEANGVQQSVSRDENPVGELVTHTDDLQGIPRLQKHSNKGRMVGLHSGVCLAACVCEELLVQRSLSGRSLTDSLQPPLCSDT